MASSPSGTVAETLTEAASRGWSLEGNQVAATSGWPATIAPSSVWMKPEVPRSSAMVSRDAVVPDHRRELGALRAASPPASP